MPSTERGAAKLALLALLPLVLWELGGGDLPLSRLFATAQGFSWRHQWWLTTVLHEAARNLAWVLALLLLVNVRWPMTPSLTKHERLWWFAATLAGAAVVPLIKQQSLTSCPWDLAEFGGVAQHLPHWLQIGPGALRDGGGGHCFPSGHATSAFCFFSAAFALRRAHPVASRRCLWAVAVIGLMLGAVQLVRGAHFASHILWSGWICFSLNAALARWLPAGAPNPAREAAPALLPGGPAAQEPAAP